MRTYRRVVGVAGGLLLAVAVAGVSLAGVEGTAHDTELGAEGGACVACHLPHQAAGDKFWAQAPVYEGKVGTVSALCASCHHSGEGYGALMTRAHADDTVYAPESHGQKMYLDDPPPATDVMASGLPGIDPEHGYFECTTCHSVHDDTYRPFLVDEPNALCARCHRLRHYVNGAERSGAVVETGSWSVPGRTGGKNPGSHPVGDDVIGGRPDGPAVTIGQLFRTPFSPDPGKWSLGAHLTHGDDGGVTCLTCHAVHGTAPDPDDPAVSGGVEPPAVNMLTVAQAPARLPGVQRDVANGDGDVSGLCEACHGVGNNPEEAPDGSSWADDGLNVAPGRQGLFGHPVDTWPARYDTGVTDFPAGWPSGGTTRSGDLAFRTLICETCHAPHPAAALERGRVDVMAGAGPYLLRGPLDLENGEPICEQCHTGELADHHPVDRPYDSRGVPYLKNAVAGQGDILTCSTCHTSAHDWRRPGQAGLDPNWLPVDNGRAVVQADDMYDPDMSKTCMDCHYFMDGDGASVSPTLGSSQTVIGPEDREYEHYQTPDRSMGTHYIGKVHETADNWRESPFLDFLDTTSTWVEMGSAYSAAMADGWSRLGGEDADGSRVLVCESCHELEPDRNRGFVHLLLAPFEEGQNGLDEYPGDGDGHDVLCQACHGVPKGTHPMTGMVVSRTGEALNTSADWLRDTLRGDVTLTRSADALSCDSCHQPHDANGASFTFCLDATPTLAGQPTVGPGGVDATQPEASQGPGAEYKTADGRAQTYATPTLSGRGGDFTGFCDQCHKYALSP